MSQTLITEANKCQSSIKELSKINEAESHNQFVLENFPWLTRSYFERVLKNYYNAPELQVKMFGVKPACEKGESFGGVLLRVYVTYCCGQNQDEVETSYIIKGQIWNELTNRTLKVYDIHNKEMEIYKNILPKVRKLLRSIGEESDLFPTALAVDQANEVIIFEDLLLKHYEIKDRKKGLDREHVLMTLTKLAEIHAASAILYEIDNTIYDNLKSGMFTRKTDSYQIWFRTYWTMCIDEVLKWKGYEKYAEKMKLMLPTLIENACKMYDRDDGDIHALTHGDLWVNNIMFNYNSDRSIKDVVILDYQYSYYASPLLDFILFIYTSTNDEIRLDHSEYLQHYHERLTTTLKKLNYNKPIPTLYQFRMQYIKKSFLKLTSVVMMLSSMLSEKSDDADFESLVMDNEKARRFKKAALTNPNYRSILQKLLPIFDREGLLDPME